MKRITFNQVFDIICITALFGLLVFAASNGVSLALSLEQWDAVATAGWALLPIAVIFLLVALGKLVLASRDLMVGEQAKQAAEIQRITAGTAEAEQRVWDMRDANKRQREIHKANGYS